MGKQRVIWYTVLFLPEELTRTLPFELFPRLRVIGEIAKVEVCGAFMPTGDGRRYFMVSPYVRRQAGVDLGSKVRMCFSIDDQDRVDIPDILHSELNRDEDLRNAWAKLTPGRQRGFAHLIHAAKSAQTRERRLLEVIDRIMDAAR